MTTYNDNNCNVVKNIVLAGFMFLSLILAIFTNYYVQSNGDISEMSIKFGSPIMASNWTFNMMWCMTYVFQFLWVLYLTILTIKFASREALFNVSFNISFIIVNIGNCAIIYFWNDATSRYYDSSRYIMFASIVCIIIDFALYWTLFQAMITLLSHVHTGLMPEWVTSTIRKLLIILLINAVAFYVGWMTYICNLNFALALQYHWKTNDETAAFVGLSCMLAFIIFYSVFNFMWLDVYFASIYTMYPAMIISLTGIITAQGVSSGSTIMAAVMLGLVSLLFIAKNVLNCIKAKKRAEDGILDYGYDMASI